VSTENRSQGRTGLVPSVIDQAARGGRKRAQGIAEELTEQIVSEGYPVGRVIGSESELLERFNVSRAVLREAIRVLEHHEIAVMRRGPRGGLSVTEPNTAAAVRATALNLDFIEAAPRDVFEARSTLELRCVELAADRIDESGIARLRASVAAEEQSGHVCTTASHEIHQTLADLSGNPAFALFINVLTQLTTATRNSVREQPGPSETHQAHRLIAEAVIAGDAALARHRMRAHLTAVCSHSPDSARGDSPQVSSRSAA
jgi:DNA-binding FadR family transcriptional regulator